MPRPISIDRANEVNTMVYVGNGDFYLISRNTGGTGCVPAFGRFEPPGVWRGKAGRAKGKIQTIEGDYPGGVT